MRKARLDKIATIEDLAQVARRRIPKITLGYLESGPGGEIALRRNREARDRVGNLTELRSRVARASRKNPNFGHRPRERSVRRARYCRFSVIHRRRFAGSTSIWRAK